MNKERYLNAMCKIAFNAAIKYLSEKKSTRYVYGISIPKFNKGIPIAKHLLDDEISFTSGITYNEFRQKFDAEIFRIDMERGNQ